MTTNKAPVKQSSFRLLILSPSPPDTKSTPPFKPFLEAVTGAKPSDEITTFAGYTSHPPLRLSTKYYTADVGIWCDELPSEISETRDLQQTSEESNRWTPANSTSVESKPSDSPPPPPPPPTLSEWKTQILSSEAAEVRAVIGGIVLLLPVSSSSSPSSSTTTPQESHLSLISTIHALRETIEDESYGRDIASLVVLQSTTGGSTVTKAKLNELREKLEDACLSDHGILGWDFVVWDGDVPESEPTHEGQNPERTEHTTTMNTTIHDDDDDDDDNHNDLNLNERNQFGEKTGLGRIIEVLEAIDWSASPDFNDGDDDDAGDSNLDLDFDDFDTGALDDGTSSSRHLNFGARPRGGLDFELQREMMELKLSMLDGDEEDPDPDQHPDQDREDEADLAHATSSSSTHDGAAAESTKQSSEEAQIAQFPALFERVVAIREAGADMSTAERERFARREVARILREMG